jgi:chorismate mutase/ribosomal protein S18 acetylase RimI-like enzyme
MPSERQPEPDESQLVVRPATPGDVEPLAALFWESRTAAHPAVPASVHPREETPRWMAERVDTDEVWLAEDASGPVGLLVLEDDWLHSLYVAPDRAGEGVGTMLLDLAKSLRPRGLGLWVFVSNERARGFYERHGFAEVRRTDGRDNEERAPDIEMAWPDPSSLQALRARVDDVDDRLAALLEERAGLTARIQQVKPVAGHAGRDEAREAQIVRRMARRAPRLGEDRLRRVMQAVIGAGLDAAEEGTMTADPAGPPGARPEETP